MANIIKSALLIDGSTLHGVSIRQGRTVAEGDEAPEFKEWKFADGEKAEGLEGERTVEEEGGKAEGQDEQTRADAFESAVTELPVEDGAPLALPPDILVTRILSLPAADTDSFASMVRLKMEKFAPVADDELEVDYEVIGATESETRVFAVAVPLSTLDALAGDLEKSGLAVTRIDSALLCEWRSLDAFDAQPGEPRQQDGGNAADAGEQPALRQPLAAVFALPSGRFDFIAADEAGPLFARTLGAPASPDDLAREVTLSLLDLAAENPSFTARRLVLVAPDSLDAAYAAALERATAMKPETVRLESIQPFVQSAIERDDEDGCIDIVPSAWRDDEQASVMKRRFIYGAIAAVALWVVIFATFMAIPRAIERQTAALRAQIAAVMPEYGEVSELRTRVRLIQSYEDRSHSVLETLRALCERMPQGMTIGNFGYEKNDDSGASGRRGGPGGIKITGDAASQDSIFSLKDSMDELELFDAARLKGPTMDGQRRRYKFELDWRFAEGGE